ncbi:MAG: hypothetical protein A2Z30_02125 [Chloroflexi bacterium RBG_16_64_43]|nr:MAG: hypothetical protein A2Z30_02125 [Chloroflexi bacterium RBG_16_64_43]
MSGQGPGSRREKLRKVVWTILPRIAFASLFPALAIARASLPEREAGVTGPRALLDSVYALVLAGAVLLTAVALGRKILARLGVGGSTREGSVVSPLLGLGAMGYAFGALAFFGLLSPASLILVAAGLAAAAGQEITTQLGALRHTTIAFLHRVRRPEPVAFLIALVLVALMTVAVVEALAPPSDYDGLMYHLVGPKDMLQYGRMLGWPDIWQANGPFTAEMLFTFGLGLGSDTFAKLTQLAFAVVYIAATHVLAIRYLGSRGAWVAVAVLLGVPLLLTYASVAYTDFAWAACQVSALLCIMKWNEEEKPGWLIVGGILGGVALGSKYLALGPVAVLGLSIVWLSRAKRLRRTAAHAVLFGLPAFLVGLPWYAKNWITLGNPVFPFFLPSAEWPAARIDLLMSYLSSFGVGHRLSDLIRIPWAIFLEHTKFATLWPVADYPGFLFPLAPLYFVSPQRARLHFMAGVAAIWSVLWAIGSQQIRFLLPVFPLLSTLAAVPISSLMNRYARSGLSRVAITGFILLSLLPTFLFAVIFQQYRPSLPVVVGRQSKGDFLASRVSDYRAMEFIKTTLPPEARVLMLWDGQSYYCDQRCLPDAEQSRAAQIVEGASDPVELTRLLRARNVTHLLLSEDAVAIIEGHDPTGVHRAARAYLDRVYLPACGNGVYRDEWIGIYEITCD